MRLLLVSDMAHTGFGRVGRELGQGLLDKGHDLRIIAINWRGIDGELGAILNRNMLAGVTEAVRQRFDELVADPLTSRMLPASITINGGSDGMGHRLTGAAMHGQAWPGWHAEAVLLVADPFAVLDRLLNGGGPTRCPSCAASGVPMWNYTPIEGADLTPAWRIIWGDIRPVAMSAFGQRELEKLLGRPVPMIAHGASAAFYPVSPATPGHWRGEAVSSKVAAKEAIGLPGQTIVLRVDRHIPRKNYAAFFRVMRPVLAAHPEVVCVIHAAPRDEQGNLFDLIAREPGAINHMPGDILGWSHPQYRLTGETDTYRGLTDAELNVLYNAADVLVSTTMAEGFGLTQVEALAAGVPVVTTDYSAISEVVGPGGVLIAPAAYITNQYAHEWALVDEAAMSVAVERLITKPKLRRELGEAGRRHVARYTWTAAVDAFDRLISDVVA